MVEDNNNQNSKKEIEEKFEEVKQLENETEKGFKELEELDSKYESGKKTPQAKHEEAPQAQSEQGSEEVSQVSEVQAQSEQGSGTYTEDEKDKQLWEEIAQLEKELLGSGTEPEKVPEAQVSEEVFGTEYEEGFESEYEEVPEAQAPSGEVSGEVPQIPSEEVSESKPEEGSGISTEEVPELKSEEYQQIEKQVKILFEGAPSEKVSGTQSKFDTGTWKYADAAPETMEKLKSAYNNAIKLGTEMKYFSHKKNYEELRSQIKQKDNEIKKYQETLEQHERELEQKNNEIEKYKNALDLHEKTLEIIKNNYQDELKTEINMTKKEIDKIKKEHKILWRLYRKGSKTETNEFTSYINKDLRDINNPLKEGKDDIRYGLDYIEKELDEIENDNQEPLKEKIYRVSSLYKEVLKIHNEIHNMRGLIFGTGIGTAIFLGATLPVILAPPTSEHKEPKEPTYTAHGMDKNTFKEKFNSLPSENQTQVWDPFDIERLTDNNLTNGEITGDIEILLNDTYEKAILKMNVTSPENNYTGKIVSKEIPYSLAKALIGEENSRGEFSYDSLTQRVREIQTQICEIKNNSKIIEQIRNCYLRESKEEVEKQFGEYLSELEIGCNKILKEISKHQKGDVAYV